MAGASADLPSALAAELQRRSILLSLIGGVLIVASTCLIAVGGPLEDKADRHQLTAGIVLVALAGVVGFAREWAQWWVDRGQQSAAAQFRTAVKHALRPVAELIATMPGKRKARLNEVAKQVTGSMQLLLTDVPGLRSVVYEVRDDGQKMEQIGYSGRGTAPGAFERHPKGEPDEAFEALEQNQSRLVHDICADKAAGRRTHGLDHDYRTYIAVPIVVESEGYGMLTLDAPEANSFTDTDLKLCEFVAELLAVAFACAKAQ